MPLSSPDDSATDDALIERLQGGDLDAFEPLLHRHLRHVRLFAALKAPEPELAGEITRDTFILAFQNISDFTAGASLRAWLRAIAGHLIRTEIERRGAEQTKLSRFTQKRLAEMNRELLNPHESREVDFFEECLRHIPPPLLEVVQQKYRDGRTCAEIAKQSHRTVARVRMILFRVRQRLSHCIAEKIGRPFDAG